MALQIDLGFLAHCSGVTKVSENVANETLVKYNTRNIPTDFMSGNNFIRQLHDTVLRLESGVNTQNDLDYAYNEFSTLLKQEMTQKLECKTVKVHFSRTNNKRRKISKPWWNSDLTKTWNELCTPEKGGKSVKLHRGKRS